MSKRVSNRLGVSSGKVRSRRGQTAIARSWSTACETLETRVFLSFTPYVHNGVSATPTYEYLDTKTGQGTTVKPLGATSPAGAPLTPALMRAAYGLGSFTYNTTTKTYTYGYGLTFNGIKGDGTGQTIAIVDVGSDPNIATDLQTFDTYWNLPAPPSFQQLSQTGSSTNLPAVANGWPGEISLDVEWSHVMAPGASIILFAASDLYAAVQYAATVPGVAVVSMSFTVGGTVADSVFTTPSGHTGVSFFAGNGDTGSEVPSPAQDANVVAVGGTSLSVASNGTYTSESTWSAGGGGISGTESQPSYQNGIVSSYSTTQRVTPDVSMDANPGTGVGIVNSYDETAAAPWELIIGGTSLATPLLAGTVAVADQGRVSEGLTALDGGSQLLPRFYQLSQSNYAANFHDVTTGNNGHPATVGYDMGTGLGSVVANNLIPNIDGGNSISGRAFIDINGNSTYEAGTDTILSGKTVYIDLNNNGVMDPTDPHTTTDANGLYSFSDVIGGFTGVVRMNGISGMMPETTSTLTTTYGTTAQTFNVVFGSTSTYTAFASPTTTTLNSSLGVTTSGALPSGLTYTWQYANGPENAVPTFTPNGTAAAINTVVKFNAAGTYTLSVKIKDAAGQIATASVVVTVTQVLTSITVVPVAPGISGGQTQQMSVNGFDQFGSAMPGAPVASWSLVSGGGSISAGGLYSAPNPGTVATVKATIRSITATGTIAVVSVPWTSDDIGNLTNNGQASDNGTTATLGEASDDIWGGSDDFQFDYQQVTGDFTMTTKLNSQASASAYIKAGLMVRNTLAATSAMAMIADPAPGPLFEWRLTDGATAAQTATSAANTAPYWLQIVRSGSTFTGYASPNGVTWTMIGSQTITMGTTVYVGYALSSHDTNNAATATFTNFSVVPVTAQTLTTVKVISPINENLTAGQSVQLVAEGFDQNGLPMATQPTFTWTLMSGTGTLTSVGNYTAPATGTLAVVKATSGTLSATDTIDVVNSPWQSADIGNVSAPGTAYDSGSTTTLTDTSDDIWNASDDFHFDYQTITGDGSITAKVFSQTTTGGFTKAGVMIRNSLAANDAMAMVFDAPNGPPFEWRTTAGAGANQVGNSTNYGTPYWFRLTRVGTTITAFTSPNGTTWTSLGSQTIAMNPTVYVGLALTSHNTGVGATATFTSVTISNPTVATAAAVTPNPVTGKTAALSVLGANANNSAGESSLSYSWAATNVPAGATTPTFSINNSNAAKNTTVTFFKAGTYTFTATISDGVGQAVTSLVTVTVNSTLTSLVVSPGSVTLGGNATQTFTDVGYDQFGVVLANQPTVTWAKTAGVGSINSTTGVYSSGSVGGSATIQASSGSIVGTAAVTVANGAPTIATAASATPSTVTGTTAALSVLGADDGGESSLTYTWSTATVPAGVVPPAYSANGTNAAKNTVATFSAAGSYNFTVTVTDGSGSTTTSTVSVIVNQTLTAVTISPTTVVAGSTSQASAVDQFGNPFSSAPVWSVNGGGGISATGLFTANQSGGSYTISAVSGGLTVTTTVSVVPTVYAGPSGADTFAVRLSPADSTIEQIFVNTPETSTPTYTVPISQLPSLTFNPAGADGSVTIDYANGNPIPAGGITDTGGNTLSIKGTSTGGQSFSINASQIALSGSPAITYSNLQSVGFDLPGSGNVLTQTAQPSAGVTLNASTGSNTLNVSGGVFTFNTDPGNLTVNDNASIIFASPAAGSGVTPRHLAALKLGANATAAIQTAASQTDRLVLVLGDLLLGSSSTLDLGGNDAILRGGSMSSISTALAGGYAFGAWTGTGITSAAAAGDTTHLTGLGLIQNTDGTNPIYPLFDQQTVSVADLLIRYTYVGDANLSGTVDGSDYSLIDSGYANPGATGWLNGDFNYDGIVDGSDYTLIDNAFNNQGTTLLAPTAKVTTSIAPATEVPGPVQRTVLAVSHPVAIFAGSTVIAPSTITSKSVQVFGPRVPVAAAAPATISAYWAPVSPFYAGTKKVHRAADAIDDIVGNIL